MALHTAALAKKVLLDFFQKIASPSFRQAESWQSPWSLAAEGEIPFQKRAGELEDPSDGVNIIFIRIG